MPHGIIIQHNAKKGIHPFRLYVHSLFDDVVLKKRIKSKRRIIYRPKMGETGIGEAGLLDRHLPWIP